MLPEDGILKVEMNSLAKPDGTEVEELPVFLAINLKKGIDMQYTYNKERCPLSDWGLT